MATNPTDIQLPTIGPKPSTALAPNPDAAAGTMDAWKDAPAAIQGAAGRVQKSAAAYGTLLDTTKTTMDQLGSEDVATLQHVADTKDALNADLTQRSTAMLARATPVFARQAAVDARRSEVMAMNPFKRAIMGLVNRNYSLDHLDRVEDQNRSEAADIGQEYQTVTSLIGALGEAATSGAASHMAVSGAKREIANADLNFASQGLTAQRAQMEDITRNIGAQAETAQLQRTLSDTAVAAMTPGDVGRLTAEARKNGFAMFHGAQLSAGQVADRSNQLERQGLAITELHLSIANQGMAMKEHQLALNDHWQRQLVDQGMSPAEVTQAAQNGGTFTDHSGRQVKVNMTYLAGRLQAEQARNQFLVGDAAITQQAAQAGEIHQQWTQTAQTAIQRMQALTDGHVPPAFNQFLIQKQREFSGMTGAINSTTDPKARATLLAQAAGKMSEWSGQFDGVLGNLTQGMARTPAAAATLHAFITGAPQDPAAAAHGMAEMLESGNIPRALQNLKGPEGAAVRAAQAAASQWLANPANAKLGGQRRIQGLMDAIAPAMGNSFINGHTNAILTSAPNFAKSVGHPFGEVTPQDWAAARAAGSNDGIANLAKKLGVNVDQARMLVGTQDGNAIKTILSSGGKWDPATNAPKPGYDLNAIKQQLSHLTMAAEMQHLDASGPRLSNGMSRSQAFVDLLKSDQFQSGTNRYLTSHTNASLGGFLGDSMTGGAITGRLSNTIDAYQGQAVQNQAADLQRRTAMLSGYSGGQVGRYSTIVGSIPGLSQHDATVLMSQVTRSMAGTPNPHGVPEDERITSVIKGGKFNDPHLERIRQTAAKGLDDATARTDASVQMMQRLHEALPGKL